VAQGRREALNAALDTRKCAACRSHLDRPLQGASLGILAIAVLLVLVWSWVPAPVHVVAASAGSGFVLGFLGAFIPNRRRAMEIRDIDHAP
jgi:putative flippase GtrA